MITEIIDFLTKADPKWYVMLLAILKFIMHLFGKKA